MIPAAMISAADAQATTSTVPIPTQPRYRRTRLRLAGACIGDGLLASKGHSSGELEAVASQPTRAGIEIQPRLIELMAPDPPQLLGLVVAARHGMARGADEVAHVEMQVVWLCMPLADCLMADNQIADSQIADSQMAVNQTADNQMYVNVDWLCPDLEAVDAGFLGGFAQSNPGEGSLAVGVSARLQPSTDLAVQEDQSLGRVVAHHPRRRRHVADFARAMQRVGVTGHEVDHPTPMRRLDAITGLERLSHRHGGTEIARFTDDSFRDDSFTVDSHMAIPRQSGGGQPREPAAPGRSRCRTRARRLELVAGHPLRRTHRLLRCALEASYQRHSRSVPLLMPMRADRATSDGTTPSSQMLRPLGDVRSQPSCSPPMPSA